jgi:predicted nucleotidyltransferase
MKDTSIRTVIDREFWCVPRATSDIDIILETSIVASIEHFHAIQESLDHLGYKVKPDVKYLHFDKEFSETESVEVNFLTGPINDPSIADKIKISRPRVRPRGDVKLHAYLTDEAIGLSENLQPVRDFSNLYLPAAVTFLIMKLHAFRDRFEADEQEKAGHHAMDVYRVISMLTEQAYGETAVYLKSNKDTAAAIKTAAEIVQTYFRDGDMFGVTKIREHPLYRPEFKMDDMRSILTEFLD